MRSRPGRPFTGQGFAAIGRVSGTSCPAGALFAIPGSSPGWARGCAMTTEPAVPGASVPESDARASPGLASVWTDTRLIRSLLLGIFILTAVYALYFARVFVMPVVLAFLLALMLTPIVRFLKKRGVPEAVSATLLVLVSVMAIVSAGYF